MGPSDRASSYLDCSNNQTAHLETPLLHCEDTIFRRATVSAIVLIIFLPALCSRKEIGSRLERFEGHPLIPNELWRQVECSRAARVLAEVRDLRWIPRSYKWLHK
ncbi:hypothetical protein CALCODRAFT_504840 [Calocera cornea HHB12733]|uniref:Uncharacterized protein n=1 Tax=Calocera cornea HHB12733 TaxID=1353952 RepID=A0A165C6S6_9BASI|nr:hypothetical protein CALCODRAFT_504840 [Calocera cornea HHB12733]